MTKFKNFIAAAVVAVLFSHAAIYAASPEIFEPAQVVKAGVDSKIKYAVEEKKYNFVEAQQTEQVSPWIQQVKNAKGALTYTVLELPSGAKEAFDRAEKIFFKNDFSGALRLYMEVARVDPAFLPIYNYIGDSYYRMKDYVNAKKNFEYETKVNYCNYQGHWFLADTLYALGEQERAAYEATVGHILNRNHKELKKTMMYYREQTGRPWKDWSYLPQCEITKTDDGTVNIKATKDWVIYGMDKALWRYEPGYAEKHHAAGAGDIVIFYIEEAEALISNFSKSDDNPVLKAIAGSDYMMPFALYEVLAVKDPSRVAVSPETTVKEIVVYINKYH
jgi:tetratricopeptide (TPR) repeat protein